MAGFRRASMAIFVCGFVISSIASAAVDTEVWQPRWEKKLGIEETRAWTTAVIETFDVSRMPDLELTDGSDFCPNYKNLDRDDRIGFWLLFLSAMSEKESNHDPKAFYKESFKDKDGDWVVSRGLLQISKESGNAYGCNVDDTSLEDPATNLKCGIRILNYWTSKDLKVYGSKKIQKSTEYYGGSRYWAVLRAGEALDFIKATTSNNSLCKLTEE